LIYNKIVGNKKNLKSMVSRKIRSNSKCEVFCINPKSIFQRPPKYQRDKPEIPTGLISETSKKPKSNALA